MGTTPVLFTPLFTSREAADALGVNRATIARWVLDGYLIPAHKAGTAYVFTFEEIDRVRRLRGTRSRRPRRGRAAA